jgi:hypothetical protein
MDDGQVAVEDDDVVLDDRGLLERDRAVVGEIDREGIAAEPTRDRVRQGPIILHDQDPHVAGTVQGPARVASGSFRPGSRQAYIARRPVNRAPHLWRY